MPRSFFSVPNKLAAATTLTFCITSGLHAGSLADDVKAIKQAGQPKALRCVLNGNPRSLAIELSDGLAVGYDTWHGGIFLLWKPTEPSKPLNLDGAVFTGAHGPQPTSNGPVIFENKAPRQGRRYHHSDPAATLHFLGYRIGKNGIVALSFAFRNAAGEQIAHIEDSCTAGKNRTLHRRLKVSGLSKGQHVTVDFPTPPRWKNLQGQSSTIDANGTSTYTAHIR